MTEALAVWVSCTVMVAILLAVFIPRLGQTGLYKRPGAVRSSGGRRRSSMDTVARWVISCLGWLVKVTLTFFTKLGVNMATLQEVLAQFVGWGTGWKDRALAAEARADALQTGLTEAQAAAQASADALAQFQADDAATDASQIAAQAQADADAAQAVLDDVLAADLPPAPPEEPPVVEEPPVEEPPVEPEPEPEPEVPVEEPAPVDPEAPADENPSGQ